MVFDLREALCLETNQYGFRHWSNGGDFKATIFRSNQTAQIELQAGEEIQHETQKGLVTIVVLRGAIEVATPLTQFELASESTDSAFFNLLPPYHIIAQKDSAVLILVRELPSARAMEPELSDWNQPEEDAAWSSLQPG